VGDGAVLSLLLLRESLNSAPPDKPHSKLLVPQSFLLVARASNRKVASENSLIISIRLKPFVFSAGNKWLCAEDKH
jgi:hypothetical protein